MWYNILNQEPKTRQRCVDKFIVMLDNSQSKNQYGVTTDEIMDYLKENMVTREEFQEELKKFATKEDLGKFKLEIFDHVDDKLADLKGDLVLLARKEDRKLGSVVELLAEKQVFTASDAKGVFQMEPFPRPSQYKIIDLIWIKKLKTSLKH